MLLHCCERIEFVSHPEIEQIHYQTLVKLQEAFSLSQNSDLIISAQASFKLGTFIVVIL
jgi:hypothetical protein